MEESRKVSEDWLESNLWEPPARKMEEEEEEGEEELEEEDLDEYEGVVQALSNLESTTRVRSQAFQSTRAAEAAAALDRNLRSSSTTLNPKQQTRFEARQSWINRGAGDADAAAGSTFVSSASASSSGSSWEEEESSTPRGSTSPPPARWNKVDTSSDFIADDSLQLEVGTSGRSVHGRCRRHSKAVLDSVRNDKLLLEKNRQSTTSAYPAAAAAIAEHENPNPHHHHHHYHHRQGFRRMSSSSAGFPREEDEEEAAHLLLMRHRIEDLEKKVDMLITEEYYNFHRISVPRGCFAVVLPGLSYTHRWFTEYVVESVQMRIESIWPLCYLSPVVAKLVGFASAMFRWLPLPTSPCYT